MYVDDLEGEKVDTELVDNATLRRMGRDYFRYLSDPRTLRYWGRDHVELLGYSYDLIIEEMDIRREYKEWD